MAEKDYKSYTENYNLIKPGDLEKYDIEEVTRTNADIIDAELKKHEVAIKNLHNYDDTEVKKNIEDLKKAQQSFTEAIDNKADKQEGKDLSTNDFTNEYKQKLDELNNYDDTEVVQELEKLQQENTQLKKTQDDMIEKQLNKQSEVDTSLIAKDTDEFYGKLSLFGGQRQEKREGYNLLKLVDKTKNVFGLTHVIKDGKITSTGTSTKSYADIGSDRDSFEIKLEAEKTYTFMRTEASFCSIAIKLYSDKNDLTSFETFTIPAYQTKTTFAPTRNTEFCYLFLGSFTAGTEFNLKEYGVMVYEGTENKEFEQYGVMPSLNYSSKIEAVGDKTYAIESGSIEGQAGANIVNQQRLRTKDFIRNTYKQILVNANGIDEVALFEYDKDKNYIKSNSWRVVPATFDLSDNTAFFKYAFRKSDNSNLSTDMITNLEDSNKCVEITTSNKNVLDIQKNAHLEVSGLAIDTDENGEVTINGTATANTYLKLYDNELTNLNYTKWDKKKVAKGNWVFSSRMIKGEINAEANTSAYVRSATTGGTEYASLWRVLNAKEKKSQFVFEEDTDVVMYMWVGKDVTFNNVKLQFQLELDELSDYVEHRGQTLIMPIQQKMFEGDTFEKIDGVWYEKHGWREIILDGTQTISHLDSNIQNASQTRFAISIDNLILSKTFCNKLTAYPAGTVLWNGIYQNAVAIYIQNNINKVVLQVKIDYTLFTETIDSAAQKVVKFKEYLKENPITVVVPIKTEYIKCTSEQSAILDKIDTYRDGTIITTDNDLCKIQLRYKQDLEKRITELENQIATTVAESE